MQHNRAGRKLGRTTAHRRALFRNQLSSLIAHERISTTLHKAKELRPLAEKLVTLGKRGGLHARRLALKQLPDRDAVTKLFDVLAPRFASRPGGYTRILKLGRRAGDGAETALIEFVDFDFSQRRAEKAAAQKAASEKKESLLEKAKRLVTGKASGKPEAEPAKAEAEPAADAAAEPAKKTSAKKAGAPKEPKPAKAPRAAKPAPAPRAPNAPAAKRSTPRKTGD
ncbi:50S ribosomal protein L17 [Acidobacteria bacterium ACD]|nr:50S ribosomal protein L17 [Acidobacteria bacterium ACD]